MNLRLFWMVLLLCMGLGTQIYAQCSCRGNYYYYDRDEDGYAANWQSSDKVLAYYDFLDSGCDQGSSGNVIYTCGSPPRYYTPNSQEDYDDTDASIHSAGIWYYDDDGDGVGDSGNSQASCGSPGNNWVRQKGDCDDNDNSVQSLSTFYQDNDNDGVGGSSVTACHQGNYVTTGGDCNDNDASVQGQRTFYRDNDGDGYGGSSVTACYQGSYVTNANDCDEEVSVTVNPW